MTRPCAGALRAAPRAARTRARFRRRVLRAARGFHGPGARAGGRRACARPGRTRRRGRRDARSMQRAPALRPAPRRPPLSYRPGAHRGACSNRRAPAPRARRPARAPYAPRGGAAAAAPHSAIRWITIRQGSCRRWRRRGVFDDPSARTWGFCVLARLRQLLGGGFLQRARVRPTAAAPSRALSPAFRIAPSCPAPGCAPGGAALPGRPATFFGPLGAAAGRVGWEGKCKCPLFHGACCLRGRSRSNQVVKGSSCTGVGGLSAGLVGREGRTARPDRCHCLRGRTRHVHGRGGYRAVGMPRAVRRAWPEQVCVDRLLGQDMVTEGPYFLKS